MHLEFDRLPLGPQCLEDDMGLLCWHTAEVLKEMGVSPPAKFPSELDRDYDSSIEDNEPDNFWDTLEKNPYSALISNIYKSLNDVRSKKCRAEKLRALASLPSKPRQLA